MVNTITVRPPAFPPPGLKGCSCFTFCYIMDRTCGWTSSRTSSPAFEGDSNGGPFWSLTSSFCTLASKTSAFCQSFYTCLVSVRVLFIFCFKLVKSAQPTWSATACAFSSNYFSKEQNTFSILIEEPSTASQASGGLQVMDTAITGYNMLCGATCLSRPPVGQTAPLPENPVWTQSLLLQVRGT